MFQQTSIRKFSISNMKLEKTSGNLLVVTVLLSVFFYMYLPFLYLIVMSGLEKSSIFPVLLALSLGLTGMRGLLLPAINIDYPIILKILFMYGLFATYALVSSGIYQDYLDSPLNILTVAIINPLFVAFAIACRNYKLRLLQFMLMMTLIYIGFLSVPVFMGGIVNGRISTDSIFQGLNLEKGFYQNVNFHLGLLSVLCISFPGTSNKRMIVLRVVGLCSFVGMLVVGGRGAFGAAAVVMLGFWIKPFFSNLTNKRHQGRVLLWTLGVVVLAVLNLDRIVDLFSSTETLRRLMLLTEGGDSSKRIYLFSKAIELFFYSIKTVLFGAGINRFPIYIGEFGPGMYPHNIVLELLAEYGVVGLTLFMMPVGYVCHLRKRALGTIVGNTDVERMIFMIVVFMWIMRLFIGGMQNSWPLLFFTFLLLPAQNRKSALN